MNEARIAEILANVAGERERYEQAWREADAARTAAVEKCVALEALLRVLRDALRPFAEVAKVIDFYAPDALPHGLTFPLETVKMDDYGPTRVRIGAEDFMRASDAFNQTRAVASAEPAP